MLIASWDTATDAATCALVRDGAVVGERRTRAARLLADVDELLAGAEVEPGALEGIAVGTGPGSYTGLRMGLVTARTLALSLELGVAGVSTLAALGAGGPDLLPVIDARRGEVFTLAGARPVVCRPDELELEAGVTCVGDGAVRYRGLLESLGVAIPPDESELHVPWARFHALLAEEYGPADAAEPIYLRLPDAERALRT